MRTLQKCLASVRFASVTSSQSSVCSFDASSGFFFSICAIRDACDAARVAVAHLHCVFVVRLLTAHGVDVVGAGIGRDAVENLELADQLVLKESSLTATRGSRASRTLEKRTCAYVFGSCSALPTLSNEHLNGSESRTENAREARLE